MSDFIFAGVPWSTIEAAMEGKLQLRAEPTVIDDPAGAFDEAMRLLHPSV